LINSIALITLCWLVGLVGWSAGLTVSVSHGHRELAAGWAPPPPELVEASVQATFIGSVPMDTVGAHDGLQRVNARTWRYRFLWNEESPRVVTFKGSDGQVVPLQAFPSWPPYDPVPPGLPLITLETTAAALWDPVSGIHVWGEGSVPNWDQRGDLWERDALFRWYDPDGTLQHQRLIGLRINGNSSRSLEQKSFRMYFDHHGDPEMIVDDFFGPVLETHERLLLRSAAANPYLFLRDALACEVMSSLGYPVSRWRPVIAMLNAEPWGMYHLRERIDLKWAEHQLGFAGDVDLIKDYTGEGEDDIAQWHGVLVPAGLHVNPADHTFFREVVSKVDLVSYMDWVILQIWSASADNGGEGNKVVYRPAGGRWHFMIHDQDAMFPTGNLSHDYFEFFSSTTEAQFDQRRPVSFYQNWYASAYYFRFFDKVTRNASGRRLLRERWELLTSGCLATPAIESTLNQVLAANLPGQTHHAARWDPSGTFQAAALATLAFVAARQPVVADHFAAFMNARMDPVEMDHLAVTGHGDLATITWHTHRELGLTGWIIEQRPDFQGVWQQIAHHANDAALLPRGGPHREATYQFTHPLPAGTPAEFRLRWVDQAHRIVDVPWVEPVAWPDAPPASVLINEFLASNDQGIQDEAGAAEDWVELYNPGDAAVDLGGYYLSDNPDVPLKWPLPAGTLIAPHGFLLIWCDDDPGDGPLHATFKLSASGESIGIYSTQDGQVVVLDEHAFGAQDTDVSEGRLPDGGPQWRNFTTPTPGGSNVMVAVQDTPAAGVALAARPNPFNPRCTLTYRVPTAGMVQLRIYDLAGRCVRQLVRADVPAGEHRVTWQGDDDRGAGLPSGTYHAVLATAAGRAVTRLSLVR
jgi:hypothetical protein